jgi:hypothetical protein
MGCVFGDVALKSFASTGALSEPVQFPMASKVTLATTKLRTQPLNIALNGLASWPVVKCRNVIHKNDLGYLARCETLRRPAIAFTSTGSFT